MLKFTPSEVCQLAGIPAEHLERWIEMGLLDGLNPRCRRRYSLSEVIAIAAGVLYRREGTTFDRCVGVASFLATLPVEHLEAELAAGRTFPVKSASSTPGRRA